MRSGTRAGTDRPSARRLCTPEGATRYRRRLDWTLHGTVPLTHRLCAGDTDCQGETARLWFEDAHGIECRVERTASRLYRLTAGAAVFIVQRAYPRADDRPSQPAYVLAWNEAGAALYAERAETLRADVDALVMLPAGAAAAP